MTILQSSSGLMVAYSGYMLGSLIYTCKLHANIVHSSFEVYKHTKHGIQN